MKLAASTLGCPEWSLLEICKNLKAFGYDGLELRGLGPDIDLTQSPAFATAAAVRQTRRVLDDFGLAVCSVDTSASFADGTRQAAAAAETRAGIDLARSLGAPFVRVFGGSIPAGVSWVDALPPMADILRLCGDYAQENSEVTVVLETHDSFSTGAQVANVLSQVGHPRVAALWDLHHPYRHGEPPEQTQAFLAPYLRHVHVKDSLPPDSYCLLGDGDVPIAGMLRRLRTAGYDGWLSLEWEKRWHPELLDPGEAFPQYVLKMRGYLAELVPAE